jgi:hypothetical protein
MTSSPPTLTGFNNNVRYRGMRFHIQTEDSGITRPHITTQLFADGGYVIKSLRTDYREYVDHPERAVLVHRLMRDQHRAMALDLRDGKLDATIDRIAPSPAESSADEPPLASRIPESAAPPSASLPAPLTEASPVNPSEAGTTAPSAERVSVTVKSAALSADATSEHALAGAAVRDGASSEALRSASQPRPEAEAGAAPAPPSIPSRAEARAAEAAPEEAVPSSSRASSRRSSNRDDGAATLRPPSSRKPQSSARPPSQHGGAAQPASSSRTRSSKAAPRHRVIPVGEAPASSKANPSAEGADRAASARRPAGSRASAGRASSSHASGSHAFDDPATTQRPPSTQKSPTSRGGSTQRPPSSGSASSRRPANHHAAATQRPPSSRKPKRAASRPAFTAAALAPASKPKATARSASTSNVRPPSSRTPPSSGRPPSSGGTATSSKRPAAKLSGPPAPSSRRAGRPSPILTPPQGGKSIFGPLPQESLDDAILSFAATVKNGPPTRGSK